MQTYWDLESKQRASLTKEQVESYVEVELMTKGVVRMEPPPSPISDPPIATEKFWVVHHNERDIAFATKQQALAFIDLCPLEVTTYRIGHRTPYVKVPKALKVEDKDIPVEAEIEFRRSALEAQKANQDEIDKKQRAYEKNCDAIRSAVRGIWEDWNEKQSLLDEMQRIGRTFDEYRAMAKDDRLALAFLRKAFTDSQIEDASEWLDRPEMNPPDDAPAVMPETFDGESPF